MRPRSSRVRRAALATTAAAVTLLGGLTVSSTETVAAPTSTDPAPASAFTKLLRQAIRPDSGYDTASPFARAMSRSVGAANPTAQSDVSYSVTPAADHSGEARISGVVTDSAGSSLAGVVLYAFAVATERQVHTTTSASGRFSLAVPAGAVELFTDAATATGGNSDATGYAPRGRSLVVAAGTRRTGVNFRLPAGAALSGRVTDTAGHPLAGVRPTPSPTLPYVESGISFIQIAFEDIGAAPRATSASGRFQLRGLPANGFTLCYQASGTIVSGGAHDASGYATRCEATPISLRARTSSTLPTATLDPATGGALTGVVTLPSGTPNRHTQVAVIGGTSLAEVTTDSRGRYFVDGLAAGRYHLCAEGHPVQPHSGPGVQSVCRTVKVRAGVRTTADVRTRLGGALGGRVMGHSGKALPGVGVVVRIKHGRRSEEVDETTSDATGHYALRGLPTGRYLVCFSTDQVHTASDPRGALNGCYEHKKPVRVRAGHLTRKIDKKLRDAGAVTGTVRNVHGSPVARAIVLAIPSLGRSSDGSLNPSFAITGSRGRYRLSGLKKGKYRICFVATDGNSILTAAGGGCFGGSAPARAKTVKVTIGHTVTKIDGRIRQLGPTTELAVRVRDSAGRPVENVDVAVLDACPAWESDFCDTVAAFDPTEKVDVAESDLTDAHGTLDVTDLEPGKYAVCALSFYGAVPGRTPATGYADSCSGTTFGITLRAGQPAAVSQTVTIGGGVSGRITDGSGHPLRGVKVHVSGAAADQVDSPSDLGEADDFTFDFGFPVTSPADFSVTRADGTFSIRGVTPGAQTVCVDPKKATGGTSTTGYHAQCFGGPSGQTSGGTPLTVTAGSVTGAGTLALTAR